MTMTPPPGYYRQEQPKSDQPPVTAFIALAFAMVGLLMLLVPVAGLFTALAELVAVVLGHIGLHAATRRRARGKEVAITGLLIGYLTILALIICAVALPVELASLLRHGLLF